MIDAEWIRIKSERFLRTLYSLADGQALKEVSGEKVFTRIGVNFEGKGEILSSLVDDGLVDGPIPLFRNYRIRER